VYQVGHCLRLYQDARSAKHKNYFKTIFATTISSECTTAKFHPIPSNEDREVFPNRWLGIFVLFRNWFTACFARAVKRRELDGWCLASRFVATLQAKVRDKPVLRSLFSVPLNEIKKNSLGENSSNGRKVTKYNSFYI